MNTPCRCLLALGTIAVTLVGSFGRASNEEKTESISAAGSSYVCVVNKVLEVPGQYCTYNAVRCPGQRTSLDHPDCSLSMGDCANAASDPNCFDIPVIKPFEPLFRHTVEPSLMKKGLSKILDDGFVPKLSNGAVIISNQLGQVEVPAGVIKMRLFLVKALDNKNKLFQIVGQGVEVESAKKADLVIGNDPTIVTFKEKVCYLDLGSVKYTVIMKTLVKALQQKKDEEPPLLETRVGPCDAMCSQLLQPLRCADHRFGTMWACRRFVR
jgi:hypothetical protein